MFQFAAIAGAALMSADPPAVSAEPPAVAATPAAQHRPCECQARPCPAGCPDCKDCNCLPKAAAEPPKARPDFSPLHYKEGVERAEKTGQTLVVFVGVPAREIYGLVVCQVEGLEGIPGPCVTVSAHRKGVSVGHRLAAAATDLEIMAKSYEVQADLSRARVGAAALDPSTLGLVPSFATGPAVGPVQGLLRRGGQPGCATGG